ncbi:MAG: CPBP family intramembrane metalloprotease [Saprospiraceae bacterium]|nr:CPBP family intramembrane metalloprotease [Saprospiraceae bacterium]
MLHPFLCLLSGVIFYVLWDFVKIPDQHFSDLLSQFGLSGTTIWVFLIYFSTINPFLEELFWRGLLKSNTTYFSVADILFGCFHFLVLIQFIQVEYAVLTIGGLIIISRVWRYLYDVPKERLAVIISHAVADCSVILSTIFLMNG